MTKNIEYNVKDFIYNKEEKTFYADQENLYYIERKIMYNFPNQGKKFYIKNHKTNNRREFVLKKETKSHYYFSTKTDNDSNIDKIQEINCIIKKLIFIW